MPDDAGTLEAGTTDAATTDAATTDAATTDAATTDAATADASGIETSTDSGERDASMADGGLQEAGVDEAGSPDASSTDANTAGGGSTSSGGCGCRTSGVSAGSHLGAWSLAALGIEPRRPPPSPSLTPARTTRPGTIFGVVQSGGAKREADRSSPLINDLRTGLGATAPWRPRSRSR
jgi:MYXO-CTERM domain-containing protein